jgi:hypothetical protein
MNRQWMKQQRRSNQLGAAVAHGAAGMAAVKGPTKKVLSLLIQRVDDTWWVTHDDVTLLTPLLNRKVLDVNVAGAFRGATGIMIMLMAAWLSSWRMAGPAWVKPSLCRMVRRCMSSASVELVATVGWALVL